MFLWKRFSHLLSTDFFCLQLIYWFISCKCIPYLFPLLSKSCVSALFCVAAAVKSSVRYKKIHSHTVLSHKTNNCVKRHYFIFVPWTDQFIYIVISSSVIMALGSFMFGNVLDVLLHRSLTSLYSSCYLFQICNCFKSKLLKQWNIKLQATSLVIRWLLLWTFQ